MNEEIYNENARTVYYFLLSLCHNPHTAQELTQETFLRTYESISRFDGSCKLSVWLCQIAKHLWYQYLEKHKREELTDMADAAAFSIDTEAQVFAKYDCIQVLKELHKLPEQMREVLYIKMSSELTFREIGEILGKSENWARVTYFRGKEKIMKGLMKHE